MRRLPLLLGLGALVLASPLAAPPARELGAEVASGAAQARPTVASEARAAAPAAPTPFRADARAVAVAARESLRRREQEPTRSAERGRPRLDAARFTLLEGAGRGPLRATSTRRVGGTLHTRYALTKGGLPFLDRGARSHVREGQLVGLSGRAAFPPLAPKPRALGVAGAVAAAQGATRATALFGPPRARLGWVADGSESVLAFEVTLASRDPLGDFRVWIDAADGRVLRVVDRLARFEPGVGVVFERNPVESKVPSEQTLAELDGEGRLAGRVTSVFDEAATEAFSSELRFEFPIGDPRFVQTSVYRGLTNTGLLAEQHGFVIPLDADVPAFTGLLAPSGMPLNNAFYVPSLPAFGFGDGDGTLLRNLGTDLDVPAHEYGHHVFEELAAPLVFGPNDPVLAMAEGVADTFSQLVGGDARIGNSVVPGAKALRTISSKARFPDFFDADPHVEGLVYAGANADLLKQLGPEAFTELLIAALPFLPESPEEIDYREAFIDADADPDLNDGAYESLIESVFEKRGFDTTQVPFFKGEVLEGVTVEGTIEADAFHVWVFSEQPPSATLHFDTDPKVNGQGDVDLVVVPVDFDETTPVMFSANSGSHELVTVDDDSDVRIDEADAWFAVILDAPGGGGSAYKFRVNATAPAMDDIGIGETKAGKIDDPDTEIDWFQFSGTAGQYVRVEVAATSGTLDPFVGVLVREPFEVLEVDDDSGEGQDALLQGVLLEQTGLHAIAVLSFGSDFDPSVGTGDYEVSLSVCDNNVGGDFDADGVRDVCDQDDDGDGFVDGEDLDPLDPAVCLDTDGDACNDCANGPFDPLDDGTDTDGDSACDAGDDDDDNDGCTDTVDVAPLVPSADGDLDFLGLDCDNCPAVPNPLQEDADGDGDGDACSVCTLVEPAQEPEPAALQLAVKGELGTLRASGVFEVAGGVPVDPSVSGLRVRAADAGGVLLDVFVPGENATPCEAGDGWSASGTRSTYTNRSGALPPGCAAGSAQGLTSIRLTDDRAGASGALLYRVDAKGVPLPQGLATPPRFLQLDLAFGEPAGPGQPSPEAEAGQCAESLLRLGTAGTLCRVTQKDGVVSRLRCSTASP